MTVSFQILDRLRAVFEENGWHVDPGSEEAERFDRLVHIIDQLEAPAQDLLVHLTADFLVHSLPAYGACVARLVDLVLAEDYDSTAGNTLIILPLVKEKDLGEPKSGSLVAYLVRAELSRRGVKFKAWDRPQLVAERFAGRRNATVLIVDDFVGTGESAVDAVGFFKRQFSNASDQVVVGALVAQKPGLDHLASEGVAVRNVITRVRGISDSLSLANINDALATMDEIEELMGVPPDYRRGYRKSEALVTLVRCPNNTFPVFWMRPRGASSWEAPFGR